MLPSPTSTPTSTRRTVDHNWLTERAGTVPWNMDTTTYESALRQRSRRPVGFTALPPTPWQPELARAMVQHQAPVYEEEIRQALLDSMSQTLEVGSSVKADLRLMRSGRGDATSTSRRGSHRLVAPRPRHRWSTGGRWDTERGDNAGEFAATNGVSVWELQSQLDFVGYELTAYSCYGLPELRRGRRSQPAVTAFQDSYATDAYNTYA